MSNSANSASASPSDGQAGAAPEAAAPASQDNTIQVAGVLDIDTGKGGNGQLLDLSKNGKRRPTDTFVPKELIRRFKLRQGSTITGTAFPAEGRFPNPKMRFIETVDGIPLEERRTVIEFTQLTTISPEEQLKLELAPNAPLTTRAVDLFCPIGKGTRDRKSVV